MVLSCSKFYRSLVCQGAVFNAEPSNVFAREIPSLEDWEIKIYAEELVNIFRVLVNTFSP
jgi:hypothetical protein